MDKKTKNTLLLVGAGAGAYFLYSNYKRSENLEFKFSSSNSIFLIISSNQAVFKCTFLSGGLKLYNNIKNPSLDSI